jgi:hypothetical protein
MRRLPRLLLFSPRYLRTPKGRRLLNQYLKWYLRREAKRWLRWRAMQLWLREASKELEREGGEREGRVFDFEEEEDGFP